METTQRGQGQKLVIVESPAKAKTIEKFLGKGYKVEASQGHVRDLPKSQIGVDPSHDFAMKYITIRGRGDILARIRKEAKAADVIYLATDPDREGEAISWHLANVLDIDTAQKCRIEFHEITKKAVKDAISHPRAIDMDRVDAQQARRALDRLVGYKISPLLWAKIKKGLSAGRVQSVATRLVVDREREIEAFLPEEYWDVTAKFEAPTQKGRKVSCDAKLVLLDGKKAVIHNEAEAKAAKKRILNAAFTVSQCKQGERLKRPQPPFTTSSLQQEASRKLNFSTAKTMQVVQQLYEGIDLGKAGTVGLVTYIRTDSVRVSEEAVAAARGFIQTQFGNEYCPEKPNQYKGRKNAQDAHEAIRPTYVDHTPESVKAYLTKEQFNLYRLIYTRFLASQMKPAVFQTLTADLSGRGSRDALLRRAYDVCRIPRRLYRKYGRRAGNAGKHPAGAGGMRQRQLYFRQCGAAFHPAACAVYGGLAGAHTGGKGYRTAQYLRADHHHHYFPRLCEPGKEAPVSDRAGLYGHRRDAGILRPDRGCGLYRPDGKKAGRGRRRAGGMARRTARFLSAL